MGDNKVGKGTGPGLKGKRPAVYPAHFGERAVRRATVRARYDCQQTERGAGSNQLRAFDRRTVTTVPPAPGQLSALADATHRVRNSRQLGIAFRSLGRSSCRSASTYRPDA